MKSLIVVLLLIPSICCADKWTNTDTALQLAYTALVVVDWGQTVYINANDDNRLHVEGFQAKMNPEETNPVLRDSHPDKIHLYMGSMILGHAVVSYLLPKDWRRIWQSVGIGIEGACVGRNWSLGVGMRF